MTTTTWLRAGSGMVALTALALTACVPEETAEFQEAGSASSPQPDNEAVSDESGETNEPETADAAAESSPSDDGEDVLIAEVDAPVTFEECEDAEESDEATVTWLDDVVAEEQRFEGVAAETVEIDGEEIEIPGVPDVVVPERVGQAGCIIEFDAPANCMAEVAISSAYIPGFTIPERTIPEVVLPDGTVLEEVVVPAEEAEAQHIEGDHHEQVCQVEEDEVGEGEAVSNVARGNISRGNLGQSNTAQANASRGNTRTDEGDFISGTFLSGVFSSGIFVPGVFVEGDFMAGYRLEGSDHTERSEEDESVSYTTEGDVLFDSDEYEMRSDAAGELEAIAEDIGERDDDYAIEVEGHTDDLPTSVYDDNYELSELRAESVVDWLVDNAGVDEDSITAEGLGQDYPRADNNSDEGRQQNRRVVITVQPQGYEPEVDYELEDAEE
ncbi:OmpA family protein [Garicola koreensis]|uniref:Outer membrane protein OmpA-like peptidoglycan-associated protein n=1 Tax=Garicola koreensis TaxID=1262554 RepID=A0A7W5XKZ0_9MICC|nr:OmpA family protein [Garicola koreensis]MBB3667520.1 outer membrane protein OmpA-like peptidoglycan-associated protein [Garicola koreensis]